MNYIDDILILVGSGIAAYLGAYLSMKGQHLAKIEDIQRLITAEESAKAPFKNRDRQAALIDQLCLAALEQRLEVHQQAYTLWLEIMHNSNSQDKLSEMVLKCQDWWGKHCLYLSRDASESFFKAFRAASIRKDLLNTMEVLSAPQDRAPMIKHLKENWADIEQAGDVIMNAAGLPSFSVADLGVKGGPSA